MHILIYHHDKPDLTYRCVKIAYEQNCIPVVLSDGNSTQIKRILKPYSGKIDIIQFTTPVGFDNAIVSGFHHIFRGSYPKHIATIDASIDNPFYIGELKLHVKESPQDIFAIQRVQNNNGWLAQLIESWVCSFNKHLRKIKLDDPLTSYVIFPAPYVRSLLDTLDEQKNAVVLKLLIYSTSQQKTVKLLPVDAVKSESWLSYLYSLYISLP